MRHQRASCPAELEPGRAADEKWSELRIQFLPFKRKVLGDVWSFTLQLSRQRGEEGGRWCQSSLEIKFRSGEPVPGGTSPPVELKPDWAAQAKRSGEKRDLRTRHK